MRGILLAAYMSTPRYGHCRFVRLLTLSLAALATPIQAQYFGRNKVQYESFDFRVLKTEHFDIYYYPLRKPPQSMRRGWRNGGTPGLSSMLDHELSGRQPLILYASAPEFQQTNASAARSARALVGSRRRSAAGSCCRTGGTLGDTDHVIGHELVHAFQYDMTGSGSPAASERCRPRLSSPLWFIEGMAEYLSLGPVDTTNRDVDARSAGGYRAGLASRHSASWTTPATSPTGTGTRSWPGSRGIGGIRSSVSCCGAPAAGATLRWHSPRC